MYCHQVGENGRNYHEVEPCGCSWGPFNSSSMTKVASASPPATATSSGKNIHSGHSKTTSKSSFVTLAHISAPTPGTSGHSAAFAYQRETEQRDHHCRAQPVL